MADDGIAGRKQDGDLTRNPGSGRSGGAYASGEKPEDAQGDNTVEGEVEDDPEASGGVDPDGPGRTNK